MTEWNFSTNPPKEGWYLIAYSQIRNKRKKTYWYIVDVACWERSHWYLQGTDDYFDRVDAWAEVPEHPLNGVEE